MRYFPVDKSEQLCELQGCAMLPKRLTQILNVPGAIHSFTMREVTYSTTERES